MCGRFIATSPPASIANWLNATPEPDLIDDGPRYNIAPTAEVMAVAETAAGRRVGRYRWGLIPSWSKDSSIGARMINARAETITEKPSFRGLVATSRCVVPMDGFYEWAPSTGPSAGKTPFLMRRRDAYPMYMAGLWTTWQSRDGTDQTIRSATVITCQASTALSAIHHRMPVILDDEGVDLWLDHAMRDTAVLTSLLSPAEDETLEITRVSTAVNNARNQGPHLIEAVEAEG
jgi:putative SOS response-associated peptidase YedK